MALILTHFETGEELQMLHFATFGFNFGLRIVLCMLQWSCGNFVRNVWNNIVGEPRCWNGDVDE